MIRKLDENEFKADETLENIANTLDSSVPDGYIKVSLSTLGKVGAPALFHIRNFSTEDLMQLSIAEQEDLPFRVTTMIDNLIYEDISVADFTEKEVIETLLFVYESFYSDMFKDQDWPPTKEDYDFLKEKYNGEDTAEYREVENALKTKKWSPKFDISLESSVRYHEIKDGFLQNVRVKKESGFECVYGLSKFGDVLVLKKFIDELWKEKDRQFANVAETLKRYMEAEEKLMKGENINLRAIPNIPAAERQKYKEFELEKSIFALQALRALHIIEFTGTVTDADGKKFALDHEDVSKWPLAKKLLLAKHPELDNQTFTEIKNHFDKLEYGIKDTIYVKDPIKEVMVDLPYSFRLDTILAALHDKRPSKTTISFE